MTALEERYCHQGKLLDELNEALDEHRREIERLTLRLERLERLVASAFERDERDDEPP